MPDCCEKHSSRNRRRRFRIRFRRRFRRRFDRGLVKGIRGAGIELVWRLAIAYQLRGKLS